MKKPTLSKELIDLYKSIASKVDANTPLDDQLKILDRGIKIEQIKFRVKDDDDWGSELTGGTDGDDDT